MQFYDIQAHPKIHALNKNYISMVELLMPKVFKALVECCESEKLARLGITPGKGPILKIKKLTKNGYHQTNILGYYPGLSDPTKKDYIYVNTHVAEYYREAGADGEKISQVILHEIVHWARFIGGKSERIGIESREAGLVFELKAFDLAYGSGY